MLRTTQSLVMIEEFNLESSLGKLGLEIPDDKSSEKLCFNLINIHKIIYVLVFDMHLFFTLNYFRLKRPQIVHTKPE